LGKKTPSNTFKNAQVLEIAVLLTFKTPSNTFKTLSKTFKIVGAGGRGRPRSEKTK
jgi:hypothetical protein